MSRTGSASLASTSPRMQSTRSRCGLWPSLRSAAVTNPLVTDAVPPAFWGVRIKCGLAVTGQRVRRCSSQSRS